MERIPVSSSNLMSVGYDPTTQIMEVGFHTPSVYQYFDVPQSVYRGLLGAPSKGSYFHQHIRNVYRYSRVS